MSKNYSIVADIVVKANNFNNSMKDATNKANNFAKNFADKTQAVSQKMGDVGKQMTAKVTAPIVAGGALAVNTFKNFDDSMRNTQALLGDKLGGTVKEQQDNMKKLTDYAKEMGATTRFSASEASDAMGFMALAGWETQEIMAGLSPILNLASASNMDLATTSDIVTDAMSMFKLESEEASRMTDVLAKTSSSTNTDVHQLGEALKYVGANASASGMDIETTSTLLGVLANNGLKGSASGTTLNAVLRDMKANAEDGAVAIGETQVALYDSNGEMRDMTEVVDDLIVATADMSTEQRDLALANVFGQESLKGINILLGEGEGATKGLRDELYNATGTAQDMADTLEGGVGGKMRSLKSAIEGLAIEFGETLAPAIQKGVEKVTEMIRAWSEMDEQSKENIIKIGAIVASIGPLLIIGSKLVGLVSGAVKTFTFLSGAISSAGGAMALLSNPIGWIVAGIASVIAIGTVFYKNFEKIEEKLGTLPTFILGLMNPFTKVATVIKLFKRSQEDAIEAVDRFGSEVSEKTQKALESYFDLADEAQVTLKQLAWGQEEITQESADKMIEINNQMNEQILNGMKERHVQETQFTQEHFAESTALSEEREAEILANMNAHNNKQQLEQQTATDRMNEIYQLASDENRALKQSEVDEITRLQNEMNENAVVALSQNEIESKIILERMKEQAGNLTSIQASEVVQNSKKATDGAIEEANRQYDETLTWIIKQRDETSVISAEEADKLIAEAKKQKDGVVNEAKERHELVVSEAQKQAGEHVDKVDWETGEILSKWDVFKNNVSTKWKQMSADTTQKAGEMWSSTKAKFSEAKTSLTNTVNEIKNNMSSKFNEAKNNTVSKFNDIKNSISSRMSDAKTRVSDNINRIKGYFSGLNLNFKSISTRVFTSAKTRIKRVVDDIKGFFRNMRLKIPSIKLPSLPKFTLTGKFGWKPPSVPKIGIKWNALGGVFNKPTIFNTANAGLQGVGEAGSEAILPLTKSVLGQIGDSIFRNMTEIGQTSNINNSEYVLNNQFTFNVNGNIDNNKMKEIAKYVAKEQLNVLKKNR